MEVTKDTKVSDILDNYGDIADVMEVFGIKRVNGDTLRRLLARAITVKVAAKVHRVPIDEFIDTVNKAISQMEEPG